MEMRWMPLFSHFDESVVFHRRQRVAQPRETCAWIRPAQIHSDPCRVNRELGGVARLACFRARGARDDERRVAVPKKMRRERLDEVTRFGRGVGKTHGGGNFVRDGPGQRNELAARNRGIDIRCGTQEIDVVATGDGVHLRDARLRTAERC